MLEVHTWEPSANSGKPLYCLKGKGVPFPHHCIDKAFLAGSDRRADDLFTLGDITLYPPAAQLRRSARRCPAGGDQFD